MGQGFITWAWGQGGGQTLTLVFLVFPLRIHSKEHFQEKYAVDNVQYADEVSSSRRLLSEQLRASVTPLPWIPSPPTATAWLMCRMPPLDR